VSRIDIEGASPTACRLAPSLLLRPKRLALHCHGDRSKQQVGVSKRCRADELANAPSEEAALAASSSCRATADRRPTDLLDWDLEASDDAGVAASRELLGIGIASRHPCISLLGVGDDVREAPGTDREDLGRFFGGVAERV
jgi:hypothetical protein